MDFTKPVLGRLHSSSISSIQDGDQPQCYVILSDSNVLYNQSSHHCSAPVVGGKTEEEDLTQDLAMITFGVGLKLLKLLL